MVDIELGLAQTNKKIDQILKEIKKGNENFYSITEGKIFPQCVLGYVSFFRKEVNKVTRILTGEYPNYTPFQHLCIKSFKYETEVVLNFFVFEFYKDLSIGFNGFLRDIKRSSLSISFNVDYTFENFEENFRDIILCAMFKVLNTIKEIEQQMVEVAVFDINIVKDFEVFRNENIRIIFDPLDDQSLYFSENLKQVETYQAEKLINDAVKKFFTDLKNIEFKEEIPLFRISQNEISCEFGEFSKSDFHSLLNFVNGLTKIEFYEFREHLTVNLP